MTATPTPNDSFRDHCREIVRRFLLTAVVVDDELSVSADPPVDGDLTEPGQRSASEEPDSADLEQPPPPRLLNVEPITWAFAQQGMVCGVVSPKGGRNNGKALATAVARADIVILDWRLNPETGETARPLLERILTEDRAHRLRLIAFYTGEPHAAIRDTITEALEGLDAPDRSVSTNGNDRGPIDFGPCRIVVYAKPDVQGVVPSTIVREEDLADRLIADFAEMVDGLLPSLILTALAAVRRNVHRVLDRFGRDLDPAYLAHRACLPQPADSEHHMVAQIASELHGIMEDAVGATNPTGIKAIEQWLASRFGDGEIEFGPGKRLRQEKAREMLVHGVEKRPGPLRQGGKDYRLLSRGFSRDPQQGRKQDPEDSPALDRRLASAMSFRQVLDDADRQLAIGTVVRRLDNDTLLLCVTPRCDAVRLTDKSSFLFLPLTDPKSRTPQVVVPTGDDEHRRMTIDINPSHWLMADFEPDPTRQCVLAREDATDRLWTFKGAIEGAEEGAEEGTEYLWIGELKPEFAQSVAQAISERMARMPLDKSEWLRRSERS